MAEQTRLFVGNLPENTIDNDLLMAFSSFGEIINVDIKNKSDVGKDNKIFAFVTLCATNFEIESCIKHFTITNFNGKKIYVTRARESFLERLQRERAQAQKLLETNREKPSKLSKKNHLHADHLNPKKRKLEHSQSHDISKKKGLTNLKSSPEKLFPSDTGDNNAPSQLDKKKKDSDVKRMESMKKKRQEFKEKKNIIKSGLVTIDKVPNKKIIFSDDDEEDTSGLIINGNNIIGQKKKGLLFDNEDDSDNDVNFEIKKQFEGKQGQKVLELQSRYKSDKRFVLDERFIEDQGEKETEDHHNSDNEGIEIATQDEKTKQLNILQDVLGVTIKAHADAANHRKPKSKFGMLRFDPAQPEHAKLLAPIEETPQEPKKKKRKTKDLQIEEEPHTVDATVEENKFPVSQEQFYKVSDTLKEAIEQPTTFSLRSLFGENYAETKDDLEQDTGYVPLETKKASKKNPLDTGSKNPFTYDSSDSEDEKEEEQQKPEKQEVRAVWKENFFFSDSDVRFSEGLAFFNTNNSQDHKERRELKSLMKKRIYNKDRKNQMFQKKIGGRKKTFKKSYKQK